MSPRPYFRHTIDQLEAMPHDSVLIAELELRTTPRARKLLASLKGGTAPAPKVDARPVPVAVERVPVVPKAKGRVKPAARPAAPTVPAKRKVAKW